MFSENSKIWSDEATNLLISLCKKYDTEFETTVKKYVWVKIAKELTEKSGQIFTFQQCDTKMKGLKMMYKHVKNHNDKSGNNIKTWKFYNVMDEILFSKPEINAKATGSSKRGLIVGGVPVQNFQGGNFLIFLGTYITCKFKIMYLTVDMQLLLFKTNLIIVLNVASQEKYCQLLCNLHPFKFLNLGQMEHMEKHSNNCATEMQTSSSIETSPRTSFNSNFMRKRKTTENAVQRRHNEKMSRTDRFLNILDRLTTAVENKKEQSD